MKPYYQDDFVTLYHGDCLQIIPQLNTKFDLVLTDPPYDVNVRYAGEEPLRGEKYWIWLSHWLDMILEYSKTTIFTIQNEFLRRRNDYDWFGFWDKINPAGVRLGYSCIVPSYEIIVMYGIYCYRPSETKGFKDIFESRAVRTTNKYLQTRKNKNGRLRNREHRWQENLETHPCPKPYKLMYQLLECFGQGKETLCDPCAGSGTSGRVAKDLGIKTILIEKEEKYCEIAANRMLQEAFIFE